MSSLMNRFKLTKMQNKIIQLLVSKIESSKTYTGTNRLKQSFVCISDEIYDKYYSDYADLDKVEQLNAEATELENYGLVVLKYSGPEIDKIIGIFDMYSEYCELIGVDELNEMASSYKAVISKYLGQSVTVDNYCRNLLEAFDRNKIPSKLNFQMIWTRF